MHNVRVLSVLAYNCYNDAVLTFRYRIVSLVLDHYRGWLKQNWMGEKTHVFARFLLLLVGLIVYNFCNIHVINSIRIRMIWPSGEVVNTICNTHTRRSYVCFDLFSLRKIERRHSKSCMWWQTGLRLLWFLPRNCENYLYILLTVAHGSV